MGRVTVNMLKGQGSRLAYLFIPAFISVFWLFICLTTTRNPNVTLEDRYLKVINCKIFKLGGKTSLNNQFNIREMPA